VSFQKEANFRSNFASILDYLKLSKVRLLALFGRTLGSAIQVDEAIPLFIFRKLFKMLLLQYFFTNLLRHFCYFLLFLLHIFRPKYYRQKLVCQTSSLKSLPQTVSLSACSSLAQNAASSSNTND